MKSINIDGQEFQYRIYEYRHCDIKKTKFYSGVIDDVEFSPLIELLLFFIPSGIVLREKLITTKWAKKHSKKIQVHKFVFFLPLSIEDPKYSKEQIKQHILNGLATYKRQLEIEAGNII